MWFFASCVPHARLATVEFDAQVGLQRPLRCVQLADPLRWSDDASVDEGSEWLLHLATALASLPAQGAAQGNWSAGSTRSPYLPPAACAVVAHILPIRPGVINASRAVQLAGVRQQRPEFRARRVASIAWQETWW